MIKISHKMCPTISKFDGNLGDSNFYVGVIALLMKFFNSSLHYMFVFSSYSTPQVTQDYTEEFFDSYNLLHFIHFD
jgi:hypothetical protein